MKWEMSGGEREGKGREGRGGSVVYFITRKATLRPQSSNLKIKEKKNKWPRGGGGEGGVMRNFNYFLLKKKEKKRKGKNYIGTTCDIYLYLGR